MYESSGSQFLRTATTIQSDPRRLLQNKANYGLLSQLRYIKQFQISSKMS